MTDLAAASRCTPPRSTTATQFWSIYGGADYAALKQRYDPRGSPAGPVHEGGGERGETGRRVPADRAARTADVAFRAYDGVLGRPGRRRRDRWRSGRRGRCEFLAGAPSQLGLARAYVSRRPGDRTATSYTALSRLCPMELAPRVLGRPRPARREFAPIGLAATRPAAAGTTAGGPAALQATATREAIEHHYDVSNTFYRWVLGPSMAYTCAVFPHRRHHPRAGAGGQVRPRLPQAGAAAGHAPARRGLRLGRHGRCTRHATTGSPPSG